MSGLPSGTTVPLRPDPPGIITVIVRSFETLVRWLSQLSLALSAVMLAVIFCTSLYGVFMRYALNKPQPWVDEGTGWMLAICVMLAVPEVQRRGEHIGIDFIQQKVGALWGRRLAILGVATVLATSVIFVWQGYIMVAFSHMLNVLSNQIPEVPLWLIQTCVPIGFALMALVATSQLLCFAAGLTPRDMSLTVKEEI